MTDQELNEPKLKEEIEENRYAKDWNSYSQSWNKEYGSDYGYLGDEWNDDGTVERERDNFYFTAYADRFIDPDMTVLEVGPGGGKWTTRIAPKVKKMIVLDVAEEMLKRTKARCESLGINNVEYVLANGTDFQPIADESIDFFFSYDVFVHIALEDTFVYAQEMYRILKPNCLGICHYAINSVPEAWHRIKSNNDWYRNNKNTLGQFYYYSPESLRRMFEYCGLSVKEQHLEIWHCTCIFEKLQNKLDNGYPQDFDLNDAHTQINKLKRQLEIKQKELEKAQLIIEAMKTSKFWKMRTNWFNLKKLLNIPSDEIV